jgi:hypothetical protein
MSNAGQAGGDGEELEAEEFEMSQSWSYTN